MFKELSTKMNLKMPITCSIEDNFGALADEARRKGDVQTWNLYHTACALAMKADGVLIAAIGPHGECFFGDGGNSSMS